MKTQLLLALLAVGLTLPAPAIDILAPGATYNQNFDTLTTLTTAQSWTNDSTLAGWSLFSQPSPGTAITSYRAGTGSINTGSFYSFGTTGSSDRALGGVGSGSLAGWIAASFTNKTGTVLAEFTANWDGEQWRNGGNTSPQTMIFEYGFGSSFAAVSTWNAPGTTFDFTSPTVGASSGALDGNDAANREAGLGGSIAGLSWAADQTLWLRWLERDDTGNDHGLAIDNFSFSTPRAPTAFVPEGGMTIAMLGLSLLGMAALRRRLA
jgi:hypothetical protein